jgi:DNA-binding NtrC family response regulator
VRFRPTTPTVLLVSDRASFRREHADLLRSAGHTVHIADGHRSAMVILRDVEPSLTLIDLPPLSRRRLLGELRSLDPAAPVLVLGDGSPEELLREVEELRQRDTERSPAA